MVRIQGVGSSVHGVQSQFQRGVGDWRETVACQVDTSGAYGSVHMVETLHINSFLRLLSLMRW